MFGENAPIWHYLNQFGGVADPVNGFEKSGVIETYPVLTIIALGWIRPDVLRGCGRLPKYNPERKKIFLLEDWRHVCAAASKRISGFKLSGIAQGIENVRQKKKPQKEEQDCVDACICLLVALHLVERKECIMVGDLETGYIVVPHDAKLKKELEDRCTQTGRNPEEWVRRFQW